MICFVVNKKSGNGRANKVWSIIEKQLKYRAVEYCTVFSRDARDACTQIREMSSLPLEGVAVIGGDGTVHGILPVLIELRLPLGIIPAGSGNDLARSLSIPFKPEEALNRVLDRVVTEMDCIRAHGVYSITVVGIGLDAEVAYAVNRSKLKIGLNMLRLGFLTYVFSLLYVLITYRPFQVKLSVDGGDHVFSDVWLLTTANLPYFGGGMKISPHSRGDDAALDICVVHGMTRLKLLWAFPKVYKGTHLAHPNVAFFHSSHVQAATSKPARAHGDGEVLGGTPITVEVCPKILKVLCRPMSV